MCYTLLIKKQAKKVLQSLARTDRNRIAEKIKLLGENPDNPGHQTVTRRTLLSITCWAMAHYF
jgi:mRNA-degrading endonuclease RelE of RelBE toxin-antitoxin system